MQQLKRCAKHTYTHTMQVQKEDSTHRTPERVMLVQENITARPVPYALIAGHACNRTC